GDVDDHESLVKAIKQVDVVISTIGTMGVANQEKIIAAIIDAGNVKANKENDEVYTQVTLLPKDDDQVYFYNPILKIRIWRHAIIIIKPSSDNLQSLGEQLEWHGKQESHW
ncbi:hypothetical protein PIB30_092595, partial [Stylosanthes scabra]|nr:hypothetical protein [Stylosanthes scabra]